LLLNLFSLSLFSQEGGIYFLPMFTGIIEETAIVLSVGGGRLTLSRPASFVDIAVGSSIAVAGVCLTVIKLDAESLAFDVMGETRNKSTLGTIREGECVNLERALCAGDRFEGHMVQGHAEGVGKVVSRERHGEWALLVVQLPEELVPAVTHKGSIALDGVSLTVVSLQGAQCSVALIPHTLEHTTLGLRKTGDTVNVETDVIGRYVRSLTSRIA